ncbi:predicted protein, partial [Nematostella vectensis]
DIGFLVDGSASIEKRGKGNFGRMLNLIKSTLNAFSLRQRRTRVSVVLYSNRPFKVFGFNRYSSKLRVIRAINYMRYPRGGTKLRRALYYVKRYLFTRRQRGRKQVLVVLTDGISRRGVKAPAISLHRAGVEVHSIGIGRTFRRRQSQQLRQLASSASLVYKTSLKSVRSLVKRLQRSICLPTRPTKKPTRLCNRPIDLGLLVDGSGSIVLHGKDNFGRLIEFVQSLVSFFRISRRHTRVGMILYSTRSYPIFRLNQYTSKRAIMGKIRNVRYPAGGTRTGQALRYARRYFFSGRKPKGRKRVLILLTDGISQDSVKGPALQLRNAGAEVFTI